VSSSLLLRQPAICSATNYWRQRDFTHMWHVFRRGYSTAIVSNAPWGEYRVHDTLQLNLAVELDHLNPGPCIQSMLSLAMSIPHFLRLVQPRVRLPQLDQQGAQRLLI
jgi:hypothetical protein